MVECRSVAECRWVGEVECRRLGGVWLGVWVGGWSVGRLGAVARSVGRWGGVTSSKSSYIKTIYPYASR